MTVLRIGRTSMVFTELVLDIGNIIPAVGFLMRRFTTEQTETTERLFGLIHANLFYNALDLESKPGYPQNTASFVVNEHVAIGVYRIGEYEIMLQRDGAVFTIQVYITALSSGKLAKDLEFYAEALKDYYGWTAEIV